MTLQAGQVAVITGAAQGIGRALATSLHDHGLQVVLADLDGDALHSAAAAFGDRAVAVVTDVAVAEQVQRLADTAHDHFGGVDLLFNNAGIGAGGPSWQIEPELWQRVWEVDMLGVVHGVRTFVPDMIAAGRGHVVNTASFAGLTAGMFNAPYAAAKHAVVSLSETLHAELSMLAPEVGVTVACPGPVDTRLLRGVRGMDSEAAGSGLHWSGTLTDEQRARLAPLSETATQLGTEAIPPEHAAEQILDAVAHDRLYVTTHPAWASVVTERAERIVADLRAAP